MVLYRSLENVLTYLISFLSLQWYLKYELNAKRSKVNLASSFEQKKKKKKKKKLVGLGMPMLHTIPQGHLSFGEEDSRRIFTIYVCGNHIE